MSAFDIAIYGHLSFDNIYDGFDYKTSVGCMGNVWSQLKLINPELKVKLEPTDLGESLIIVDREQCKRTSISHLSLRTSGAEIHDSKVSHVMYLNELSNTSFVADLKGYITADVCNGKLLDINNPCLRYIDLLLISDEDALSLDIHQLAQTVKGSVLMHYPAGSTLYGKKEFTKFKAEIVNNINVLGAGDKLAAYILDSLLEDNIELPKVIQRAHNGLTEYFKNEKV